MKKNDLTGTLKVFRFTIDETLKSKSFIFSFLLMILGALFLLPVMTFFNKDKYGEEYKPESIENIYFINSTSFDSQEILDAIRKDQVYDGINIVISDKDSEEIENEITENSLADVLFELTLEEDGYYNANFKYNDADGGASSSDVSFVAQGFGKIIDDYKIDSLEKGEALDKVNSKVYGVVNKIEEYVTDKVEEGLGDQDYNVVYIMIFVYYLLIVMSSSVISSKVAEEKTNRIVEYILTTVRPMALVLGKVLGMLLVNIGQFVVVIICGRLSSVISKALFAGSTDNVLSEYLSMEVIKNLNPVNIILCVLILAIGIAMYGIIAGLFGSSVSKIEELAQGLQTFTMLIVVSFLMDFAALVVMMNNVNNPYVVFAQIFPFTSVMILPATIIIGKASTLITVISVIVMLITLVVSLKFVAVVYESVVVANGSPISFKQMIDIAKGSSGKKRKEVSANE